MKRWSLIATVLAVSGVAHADQLEDASLRQVTPQALGSVQAAPYFHGLATSEKTDWSIVLEAPRCYWFSGVSAPGARELALYLWAPNNGARLVSERSESGQVTLAWCAQQSGMYRFQAKIDGKGDYVVGVFGKMPGDPSTAPPVELPRLAPPPPSPEVPPPPPIVVAPPPRIVVAPPPPPPPLPPPPPSGPPPWYKDGGGWALSTVGVASLVAGVILVGTAASNFDYASTVTGEPAFGMASADGARSDGTAFAAVGAVALAVGTGLLVGGIVKFARHPKEKAAALRSPSSAGSPLAAAPLLSW